VSALCVSDFDVAEATSDGSTRLGDAAVRGACCVVVLRAVPRAGAFRSRTGGGSVDGRGSAASRGSDVDAAGGCSGAADRSSAGDARGSDGAEVAGGALTLAVGEPG
jgi:hypothetical protein